VAQSESSSGDLVQSARDGPFDLDEWALDGSDGSELEMQSHD
jgi:hypothetical protein